jgi:hypothetical protein
MEKKRQSPLPKPGSIKMGIIPGISNRSKLWWCDPHSSSVMRCLMNHFFPHL